MKLLSWSLRIVIGLVFIAGGFLKLYPIEPFELVFVDMGIANWAVAPFMARLLIAFEMGLGLAILFKVKNKEILYLTISTLVFFTFYLLYTRFVLGQTENCGCFGALINISPVESIIKNIVLIILTLPLLKYDAQSSATKKKTAIVLISISLSALAAPFILNTVDFASSYSMHSDKVGKQFQIELLKNATFSNHQQVNLMKGKKLICFYSLACPVCRLAASKISVMQKINNYKLPIYIIFWGEPIKFEQAREDFFKKTKTDSIPYLYLDTKPFFSLAGNHFPSIFFLDNGKIVKNTGYRDFSPTQAELFLTK